MWNCCNTEQKKYSKSLLTSLMVEGEVLFFADNVFSYFKLEDRITLEHLNKMRQAFEVSLIL